MNSVERGGFCLSLGGHLFCKEENCGSHYKPYISCSVLKQFLISYTADFKLNAIEKANEVGNREAARFFNVGDRIFVCGEGTRLTSKIAYRRKRADRRGKPHWPELEAEINKWILKERDDGKAVSTVSIRMKARVIAREMNIVNFSGKPTWCYRFMKEKQFSRVRSRSTVGQKLPDDWGKNLTTF
ncbi:pogo transposable element with KRAB [Trichonephila clavipes]|nr:pogo transposable element with KRAB [Trichonephila clavipes]